MVNEMGTQCCNGTDNRETQEWAKLTKILQKVTPGSVAESGLEPGDLILKIGATNATNLTLNDAQGVIQSAANLIQLTIKKGAGAPSPLSPQAAPSQYSAPPQQDPRYNSAPNEQQHGNYSFPDYRVGSGYEDLNSGDGHTNTYAPGSSPYGQAQSQAPSGYSTLPARSGQNNESFRQVQDSPQSNQQQQYPCKSTAGIKLQMRNPQRAQDDGDMYSQQRSSPAQYPSSPQDQQYQRQHSGGSNRSDSNSQPQSYFKKPTPFSPQYNGNSEPTPMPPTLQRQTSSGSSPSTAFKATLSQPSYNSANNHSPGSDEGPPPPPPPVNYRQPEPYQRQTSQGSYNSSPYQPSQAPQPPQQQRQNSYEPPYQQQRAPPQQQPGMYVDTTDGAPQYHRQGSRPQEYTQSPQPYQPAPPAPPQKGYYASEPQAPPQPPPPAPYQRQPSYTSQPQTPVQAPPPPQYGSPYTPPQQQQQQQQYNRQPSRDQAPPTSYPATSPQGGSGINSFEDILQPFDNFQNSNYCDKLFSRDNNNRGVDADSGINSDFSQSFSSDTPRSTQSNYSSYSPPQPGYPTPPSFTQAPPPPPPNVRQAPPPPPPPQGNLLQPATAGPPPPAVTPPPPPPPPPPSDWQPTPRMPPAVGGKTTNAGGQDAMPDKVLNTMIKNQGTQKPFAYVPTGTDLKKFKERARQRQQQHRVMPRAYDGPPVEDDQVDNRKLGGVPTPDTGVYKHAQYNSPLKMYSSDNAKDAFSVQSGGQTEVTPGANGHNYSPSYTPSRNPQQFISVPQKTYRTPERRTSDIKESEVYKMIKDQDAKGKNGHVAPQYEYEAYAESRDSEPQCVAPPPASRGQGLSFRVLQWMTDTGDDNEQEEVVESYKPKKPRNPLLRHNSEDDEMRFTGLHTKADIPSKAFSLLNKLVISDDAQSGGAQTNQANQDDEEPSRIGNYDEASIRYRGKYIPSPSFRLLQTMAKEEERNFKPVSPAGSGKAGVTDDDEDDGLPDKLTDEEMTDKRYTGANIPSKSFRALQMFTDSGDEGKKAAGGPGGGPKIKVVNRSAAMSPSNDSSGTATPPKRTGTPADNPISDF